MRGIKTHNVNADRHGHDDDKARAVWNWGPGLASDPHPDDGGGGSTRKSIMTRRKGGPMYVVSQS